MPGRVKVLDDSCLFVTRFVRRLRVGPLDPDMYYGRASGQDIAVCSFAPFGRLLNTTIEELDYR